MELFDHLALGFSVALSLENVAYCLLGCLLGTMIGVLPGIGPVPTIAMLLPITYVLPPVAGLIMLAGIYYGAQRAGRRGPGHRRHRIVLRRLLCHGIAGRLCTTSG
jgi:TctA family transporter